MIGNYCFSITVPKNIQVFCALMLLFLFSFPGKIFAQEPDEEQKAEEVIYKRPSYKVFKNLSAALAQPDSVFILELKGKKLKEFPEDVFKLPYLLVLDLSNNKIKSVPSSISKLNQLEELDMTGNKLQTLPPEIGELVKVKKLALNRNVITDLPATIGNMELLEILELWDNEIGNLPDEMKNLKNLKKLELRGILFSKEHQQYFHDLMPNTRINMSPPCDCKTF